MMDHTHYVLYHIYLSHALTELYRVQHNLNIEYCLIFQSLFSNNEHTVPAQKSNISKKIIGGRSLTFSFLKIIRRLLLFARLSYYFTLDLSIPHICHRRHGRRPCKFFLAGVNFFRFNAKNWQFTV